MSTSTRDDEVAVKLPSGGVFYVHPTEVSYLKERASRYQKDNALSNVADLQDLDRVLMLELLCFRWGNWIMKERDYWGDPVDPNVLQKALKDHSAEIRLIKKQLGMDKPARMKETGIDSPIVYIEKLLERARHFGINRDNMTAKAIELMQEIIANLTLFYNCTPDERAEMVIGRGRYPLSETGFLSWLKEEVQPDFEAVDAHFRETNQRAWVGDM